VEHRREHDPVPRTRRGGKPAVRDRELQRRHRVYRKNILGAGTGSAITRTVIAPKADPTKVYRFTLHAKLSEGSDGFVQVYLDGSTTPAYSYTGQFGFTTGYHPTHLRAGLYPGATSTPTGHLHRRDDVGDHARRR
jgi:hypothetical protein